MPAGTTSSVASLPAGTTASLATLPASTFDASSPRPALDPALAGGAGVAAGTTLVTIEALNLTFPNATNFDEAIEATADQVAVLLGQRLTQQKQAQGIV